MKEINVFLYRNHDRQCWRVFKVFIRPALVSSWRTFKTRRKNQKKEEEKEENKEKDRETWCRSPGAGTRTSATLSSVSYQGAGDRKRCADGPLFGFRKEEGAGRSVPAARKRGVCEHRPSTGGRMEVALRGIVQWRHALVS